MNDTTRLTAEKIMAAVNKALQEAVTSAEKCRGQPSMAGVRPEWDDGYISGIKTCGMIAQVALRAALAAAEGANK